MIRVAVVAIQGCYLNDLCKDFVDKMDVNDD